MFPDAFIQGSLGDKTFLRTDKSASWSYLQGPITMIWAVWRQKWMVLIVNLA